MDDLQTLFGDHYLFHSEYQMDHFITNRAGVTIYGQYKQALRELYKRWRGLREHWVNQEHAKVDLLDFANDLDSDNAAKKRRAEINTISGKLRIEEIGFALRETWREFCHFYDQAARFRLAVGELTPEARERYEREMWVETVEHWAALDAMATGSVSRQQYEMAMAMEPEDRNRLLLMFQPGRRAELMDRAKIRSSLAYRLPAMETLEIDFGKLEEILELPEVGS